MSEYEPLVSVVTPVYNGEPYISECIASVLAQTYSNWEYIIVNNCSTDDSLEIASAYANRDRRIRVHSNATFLSALANHNASLRLISPRSKYCKIVFADDWLFPDCLERMVSLAERCPSVGIVGAYVLQGSDVICTGLPYTDNILSGREVCRRHLLDKVFVFGSANSLLYRAEVIRTRDPFYRESDVYADTEACFEVLRSWDFGFVHQVLTFTRLREDSLNAKATEIQTCFPAWLHLLASYGKDLLAPDELRREFDQHLANYYRFLGKSLVLGRSNEFWHYHKSRILSAGVRFSRLRLINGMLSAFADYALNPKSTIKKALFT